MQSIKVRIKPDGTSVVEVNGVTGPSCKDLTRNLENALGSVTSDEPTREMYEKSQEQTVEY